MTKPLVNQREESQDFSDQQSAQSTSPLMIGWVKIYNRCSLNVRYIFSQHFLYFCHSSDNPQRSGTGSFQEIAKQRNADLTSQLSGGECEKCDTSSPYRTITGCCNNLADKTLGQINTPLSRLTPIAYEDSKTLPRGGMEPSTLPSPRNISSTVHRPQSGSVKPQVSVMLMQFGQFLDHDISLTPEQGMLIYEAYCS